MLWLISYILTIFGANWALKTFGFVPLGFGIMAPAGVFFAGLALTLRDLVQDRLGRGWTFGAIVLGALLSALLSPQLALASGASFLLSETVDLLVYTPLRSRSWLAAVIASNTAGDIIDSILFLTLAFGSLQFLSGQLIGKWLMVLPVVALHVWRVRRATTAAVVA